MGLRAKLTFWSFSIATVGITLSFLKGAVHICGKGGWGVVPFFIGLLGLLMQALLFPSGSTRQRSASSSDPLIS